MMRLLATFALSGLIGTASAQTGAALSFEVASVKPAAPNPSRPLYSETRVDPGRITYTHTTFKNLIMAAYDLKVYQVTGPAWIESERYDIVAKLPEGTTKDQSRVMLQNLLAERFKLVVHTEQKDTAIYNLVVGKNGPKLNESDPKARRETNSRFSSKLVIMTAKGLPISGLIGTLTRNGRPVMDKTGLTGTYDFTLEFAPEPIMLGVARTTGDGGGPVPSADSQGPSITTAVQEQLGLKLEPARMMMDMLVVDKAEKVPIEN